MYNRAFESSSRVTSTCVLLNQSCGILDGIAKKVVTFSPVVVEVLHLKMLIFLWLLGIYWV